MTEDKICDFENASVFQSEQQLTKWTESQGLYHLIPERRENGTENMCEEIMVENFTNLVSLRRLKKLNEPQIR